MAQPAPGAAPATFDRHPPMRTILDALGFRLSRMNAMNQRLGTRSLRRSFDLSLTQWRVLGVASALEPASFQAICDTLFMDKAQVSRALKVLVERALVTTESDPEDGRQVVLRLTGSGRVVHDRALAQSRAHNEADLHDLTPAEVASLFGMLGRIERVLERQVAEADEQPCGRSAS